MRRWIPCILASLMIHSLVLIFPVWPSLQDQDPPSRATMDLDLVICARDEAVPEQKPVVHPQPQPVPQQKREAPSQKKEKPAAGPAVPGSLAAEDSNFSPPTPAAFKNPDEPSPGEISTPPPSPGPRTVSPADVLSRVSPVYPLVSRRRGEEGEVRFLVRIDPAGKVVTAKVVLSSGHPSLDASALEAVRKWLFAPGSPEDLIVPVIFRLE